MSLYDRVVLHESQQLDPHGTYRIKRGKAPTGQKGAFWNLYVWRGMQGGKATWALVAGHKDKAKVMAMVKHVMPGNVEVSK